VTGVVGKGGDLGRRELGLVVPPPEPCSDCGAEWDDAGARCSGCGLTIEAVAERIAAAAARRSP